MFWRLVLVLAIQLLFRHVFSEAILYSLVAFYVQLQINEFLAPGRFIIDINAFHDVLYFALEQLLKRALDCCVFHLLVQLLAQDLVEFTNILLLVDVVDVPAKGK